MTLKTPCISIIIPFYNAQAYIKNCIKVLLNQDLKYSFEIIMIDDASTDKSKKIVKTLDCHNLHLYSLPSNSGPAAARNLGLKKAKGEYIFFLDVDDTISTNTLSTLYAVAKESNCDFVMCDKKWIENSKNQRKNIFFYPSNCTLGPSEILEVMLNRFYNPLPTSQGLFDLCGKLIKRSIITKNKLFLNEKLRYMEDEVFMWNIIAFSQNVRYVRKQFYSHYVYPNVNTAASNGLHQGFPVSYFKLIKKNVKNSLKQKGLPLKQIKKIGDQAFIFTIISALVSYSRSMILGKVELKNATKCRKKIIKDILSDHDVSKAIRNYLPSKNESRLIPIAITLRLHKFLEFACNIRAREVLRIRRKNL